MTDTKSLVGLFFVGLAIILLFQNCSKVDFAKSETVASTQTPSPAPSPSPTPPPPPPPPVCEPGETLVDGVCKKTIFTDCVSFVELIESVIPPLSETGVCFFKKLASAIEERDSGGEIASDVLAKRHSGGQPVDHPYVLSDAAVVLTFSGQRKISITSSKVGDVQEIERAKLLIDNFVLIEVEGSQPGLSYIFAGGTDDSQYTLPSGSRGILVDNVEITNFNVYAPGGTATVDSVTINTQLPLNQPVQIRTRMLDAGVKAKASDIYLIIH